MNDLKRDVMLESRQKASGDWWDRCKAGIAISVQLITIFYT